MLVISTLIQNGETLSDVVTSPVAVARQIGRGLSSQRTMSVVMSATTADITAEMIASVSDSSKVIPKH